VRAALVTAWTHLQRLAEQRLPALTRLKRAESLPILLHRRRIYVVPSRFGLIYSAMLLVMLIGALNYANNPALLLTCLLGAAAFQSVFAGFRTLDGLQLQSLQVGPGYAGGELRMALRFATLSPKRGLRLRMDGPSAANAANAPLAFDLGVVGESAIEIVLPAPRRGWLAIGRLRIWTAYPYGLFHVWSWLHPDQRVLIYPRIEPNAPPLPHAHGNTQARALRRDDDDFGALREYRSGDPRRRIAWKASARRDHWLVKEFEAPRNPEIVLDWHCLDGLDPEARISRLSAWVERAEGMQLPYRLTLPHTRLGPALGSPHRHACLRELALMPGYAP